MGNKLSICCCRQVSCSGHDARSQVARDVRHGKEKRSERRKISNTPKNASGSAAKNGISPRDISELQEQQKLEEKREKIEHEIRKELKLKEGAENLQKVVKRKKHLADVNAFLKESKKNLEKLYNILNELNACIASKAGNDNQGEPLPKDSSSDDYVSAVSQLVIASQNVELHQPTGESNIANVDGPPSSSSHEIYFSCPLVPMVEAEKQEPLPSTGDSNIANVDGPSSSSSHDIYVSFPSVPMVEAEKQEHLPSTGDSNIANVDGPSSSSSHDIYVSFPSVPMVEAEKQELLPSTGVQQQHPTSLLDFWCRGVLGKGGFGKVLLAEHKCSQKLYAAKAFTKAKLSEDSIDSLMCEKEILKIISSEQHPFLVNLYATFQTESHLFFLMEYAAGRDLWFNLKRQGAFPEHRAVFYASCVVLGLEFLHEKKIAHRDLKLDNIVLDQAGYAKITDFGLSKSGMGFGDRTNSRCGTLYNMAPEIFTDSRYTNSVDWWSLGCVIYEMLVGQTPFMAKGRSNVIKKIVASEVRYPKFLSPDAILILKQLLHKKPKKRLGASKKDAKEVKIHPFFKNIDWDKLFSKQVCPPYVPIKKRWIPINNTNSRLVSWTNRLSFCIKLPSKEQKAFKDFDWSAEGAM